MAEVIATKLISTKNLKLYGGSYNVSFPKLIYGKTGQKLLYICDALTIQDVKAGVVLNSDMGSTINRAFDLACEYNGAPPRSIILTTTHLARAHKSLNDRQQGRNNRKIATLLVNLIKQHKPDTVIFAGPKLVETWIKQNHLRFIKAFRALNRPELFDKINVYRGHLLPVSIGGYQCNIIQTFSPRNIASSDPKHFANTVQLLGLAVRDFELALHGKNRYSLTDLQPKLKHILTIKAFDKFYEELLQAKTPSIDTEDSNLNRIYDNKLLVILFCLDGETCYQLPMFHRETPFTGQELAYIIAKLKHYFEYGPTVTHIYQNAKFDLHQFFSALNIRYYNHKIYDLMIGSYNLEENRKFVRSAGIDSGYTLDAISSEYGGVGYLSTVIAKADRAHMEKYSLQETLEYGALDVLYPYHIARFHIKEAKRRGDAYKGFYKVVVELGSNILYIFTIMERNGLFVDKRYLASLMAPNSDINIQLNKAKFIFRESKAVQKANKLLLKDKKVPKTQGIFGNAETPWMFDINKQNHQQKLFFDILKLRPVQFRKDGGGKLGKVFAEEYAASVPEVEMLSNYSKLKQLKSTYIEGLLKKLGTMFADGKDWRLRSNYVLVTILTGRSGSTAPNMQNIPSHGKLAKIIKRMFVAMRGNIMVSMDFCLAGNTLIATDNGLIRIDELGSKIAKKNQAIDININVNGIKGKAIAKTWLYNGVKSTLNIETDSGNSINCTNNHKLYVYNKSKNQSYWKKAEDCKIGDYLHINLKPMTRKTILKFELTNAEKINTNNSSGITNVYKDKRYPNNWYSRIKINGKYKALGMFKSIDLAVAARLKALKKYKIQENISFRDITKPTKMTPELAYILACLVSEGWVTSHLKHNYICFSNNDKKYHQKYVDCIKKVFNLNPTISLAHVKGKVVIRNEVTYNYNFDHHVTRIRSNQLAKWLIELGVYSQHNLRKGKKPSHYKNVPWSILQADKESQLAFLAAYLEGDGSVDNTQHNVRWYSASKKLVNSLTAMLNSHGYFTYRYKNATAYSVALSRINSQKIWIDLKKYMVTKNLDDYECVINNHVDKQYTKIKSIRAGKPKKVYDLCIQKPSYPAFTANGLIVHNSSHEVRGWGNISQDQNIANSFLIGLQLRTNLRVARLENTQLDQEFFEWFTEVKWSSKETTYEDREKAVKKLHNHKKLHNLAKILLELESKGDSHKVSYELFHGKPAATVTKEERQGQKQTVFGTIYGKMAMALARDVYKEVKKIEAKYRNLMFGIDEDSEEYEELQQQKFSELKPFKNKAQGLINLLFTKFKSGGDWLKNTAKEAREEYRVTSIFGAVRHLWGYLHHDEKVHGMMDRRSGNSVIQGPSSQIGFTGAKIMQDICWELMQYQIHLGFLHGNAVHDSVNAESKIKSLPLTLYYLEHAMTTQVHKKMREVFDFIPLVDLEVDIELGGSLAALEKWDYSSASLYAGVEKAIDWMNKELNYGLNKAALISAVKYNQALIEPFRLQELQEKLKNGGVSETMLLTPKKASKLGFKL